MRLKNASHAVQCADSYVFTSLCSVAYVWQVVSLIVRSNVSEGLGVIPPTNAGVGDAKQSVKPKKVHNVKPTEELDYALILNAVLPADIRVVAWAPVAPSFSSRFQCLNRIYKYYFYGDGMDIELMRRASQHLIGEHDFRNFCSMDVTNSAHFHRNVQFLRIEPVSVDERDADWSVPPSVTANTMSCAAAAVRGTSSFTSASSSSSTSASSSASPSASTTTTTTALAHSHSTDLKLATTTTTATSTSTAAGGSSRAGLDDLYVLTVGGNAFLYHQVRCMCAVLFLVGRGLEKPEIVTQLLDLKVYPKKPQVCTHWQSSLCVCVSV